MGKKLFFRRENFFLFFLHWPTSSKMANFGGVYFLPFFPKTTLSSSKWQFLEKMVGFRGNIAVLRHLEWFLEKMAESRPPLKWPILGGLLSSLFSKNHSKCQKPL